MVRWLALVAAVAVAVLAASCTRTVPRTQVMLIVEGDPIIRRDARRVAIAITGHAGGGVDVDPTFLEPMTARHPISWPVVVALIPRGNDATRRFEVAAEAFDASDAVIGRVRVRSGYAAERTVVIRLRFEDTCRATAADCNDTQTCRGGTCVATPDTDPNMLPDFHRSDVGDAGPAALGDADPPSDAGPDSAPGDAGPCTGRACDPVVELAVTEVAACARTRSGAVLCWGGGSVNGVHPDETELGTSCADGLRCVEAPLQIRYDADGSIPSGVGPLPAADMLRGGQNVACARIAATTELACWGSAWTGSLGTGSLNDWIAQRVRLADGSTRLSGVVDARLGAEFGIALRSGSPQLVAWGEGDFGQFGTGTVDEAREYAAPIDPALGGDGVAEIAAGGWHVCVITDVSTIWCWGENDLGQSGGSVVGPGAIVAPRMQTGVPVPVDQITAGRGHTCARSEGRVFCWGARAALGVFDPPDNCEVMPMTFTDECSPMPVETHSEMVSYASIWSSAEPDDVCALTGDGTALCWGLDPSRAGTPTAGGEPQPVSMLPDGVTAIGFGERHGCALVAGDVWCWGQNDLGQLGRGRGTIAPGHFEPAPVVWE